MMSAMHLRIEQSTGYWFCGEALQYGFGKAVGVASGSAIA
jgi:hypothetical protein